MELTLLPLDDYPAGSFRSVEVLVPDAAASIVVHVARNTDQAPDLWADPECFVDLYVEVFADEHGSEGWVPFGHCGSGDGRFTNRFGVQLPSMSLRPLDGLPSAGGRRLRARIEATRPIRTRVWVEVL